MFLGIYWTNHHHMFQAVERVNGAVLWANLHRLLTSERRQCEPSPLPAARPRLLRVIP